MKNEVIKILKTADFQMLGNSISIEDIVINFDAILIGPHSANDLVLIRELAQKDNKDEDSVFDLIKKIDVLSLLLARTNSTRIINLIYIGKPLQEEQIRELEGYCRLIQIPDSSVDVDKYIYSLLPLDLPPSIKFGNSALSSLEENLGKLSDNNMIQELIRAAHFESEDVKEIALLSLDSLLEKALK